jgi:hypothetical protein
MNPLPSKYAAYDPASLCPTATEAVSGASVSASLRDFPSCAEIERSLAFLYEWRVSGTGSS